MSDWIKENVHILTSLDSVFVSEKNKGLKTVKVINASPEKVELNDFFEENVEISFTEEHTKHVISLQIDELSNTGTTFFQPIEHRELKVERSTKRYYLKSGDKAIVIDKFLSDYEIAAMVEFNDAKIDRIVYTFQQALLKYFQSVDIYFFHEIMTSTRGKTVKEFRKPIFINNINDPKDLENTCENCMPGDVYFKRIKPYDRKIPLDAVSDITVPIYYKKTIPYGFIQVCGKKKVPKQMLSQIQSIAEKLNQQLMLSKIFSQKEEKILVTDLSSHGLGILFNNRKLVTIFKKNALVSFQIIFPGNQAYNATGFCRNVGGSGKGQIKAGLEFTALPKETEAFIDSFLS